MKTSKKKLLFWHNTLESIETQTIRKFLIITASILFVMWILQILFFEAFYENVRMQELYKSTKEIQNIYLNQDYHEDLNNYAFKNNLNVIISKIQNGSIVVDYSTYGINQDQFVFPKIEKSLEKLGNTTDTYIVYENLELTTRVYFEKLKLNNNDVFLYIETLYTPLQSTNEVFIRLLLVASVISFIIAMFFSYFLSKAISEPILNISKKAKTLSEGEFDINFSSNEYEEVKQLSDTLNYAIQEIKKSQILQKEVICNVTHELKTPLTMIQSYAELINDISGDNKEKREEHLKIILEETKRLEYLVDDIMQYSKLESGLIEYNYSQFDLVKVVKKLEEFYKEKYEEKGFNFVFNYEFDEFFVYGDINRIEQVIINFLNNAVNYSTDKKLIKVYLNKEEDIAKLIIRDYGMGISKEDLEHIFEKHFRSIGAKRVSVGSGIGLSICKSILEEHKLRYGVQSEVGKGSAFYVNFIKVKENLENK